MTKSKIEWTDRVWNPVIGCTRVSEGCRNCYAERMAHRHASNPKTPQYHGLTHNGKWTGEVRAIPERFDQPTRWRKPAMVFVNSMSDLFHDGVSGEVIARVFETMALTPHHTYQVLTKRPVRMQRFIDGTLWAHAPLPNVWLGVSVEDQVQANTRLPLLLDTPAAVRWVSLEPMLGRVKLSPWLGKALNWVVCGGESGPGARPMHPQWVQYVRDQCRTAGTPFMFKQWGEWLPGAQADVTMRLEIMDGRLVPKGKLLWRGIGNAELAFRVGKTKAGRLLDGILHDNYPEWRGHP
jgi:protein gp37